MVRSSKLAILAACGAVAGLSSVSLAQPAVVSISGATLLENYLNQSLATVDFIDADGNGVLRGLPLACRGTQQLAPNLLPTPGCAAVWDPSVIWGVQYTAVGSTPTDCADEPSTVGRALAVVFSRGMNLSVAGASADEIENADLDPVFVQRTRGTAGSLGGEYDDAVVGLTPFRLFGTMIKAQQLP